MYRSRYTQNIIQVSWWLVNIFILAFGVWLINGCSQEMGSRHETTVTDPNGVTTTETYTDFKLNYFFLDRKWRNFNYGDISFDGLDGKSKSVEVDLLRQKGSVK